jgi:hypothetical protein
MTARGASGLLRVTSKIDETVAVKFVRVYWVGEAVAAVRKARITTQQSAVDEALGVRTNSKRLHRGAVADRSDLRWGAASARGYLCVEQERADRRRRDDQSSQC